MTQFPNLISWLSGGPSHYLFDGCLVVLLAVVWVYAWRMRHKAVGRELARSHRLAADLEHSRAEARRNSYFLSAVSHDLRTPLNGLLLQAELAEMSMAKDDHGTAAEAIAQVKRSARAAADLLGHFLEIGRVDWRDRENEIEEIELAVLVKRVADSCQTVAEYKRLYLRTSDVNGTRIRCDAAKLERILLNLVQNGLKFTEQGGVSVEAQRVDDDLLIHVVDSGEGIATEHHERLFEEFFQIHNSERDRTKGFGLGLALARRLAEQLGGSLTVSSAVGQGSRFTLRLPGACRAEQPPQRAIVPDPVRRT